MRRSRCKRNNSQAGGGLGGVVEFKADPLGPTVNNTLAWTKGSSCLDATASRPGFLSGGVTPQGLPGMSGGKRSGLRRRGRKGSRKGSRKASRKNYVQSGGRYGFDAGSAAVIGGTPSTSGYAPVSSIPCEASRSAIPDNGASNTLNSRSSELWSGPQLPKGMTGGGQIVTPSPASWGASHSQGPSGAQIGLEIDKASYTQNAQAPIVSSAGTNIMINTPSSKIYDSAACFKTGGGKASRRRRAKTGGGRRSRRAKTGGGRKSRKSSRKNRKSHKN